MACRRGGTLKNHPPQLMHSLKPLAGIALLAALTFPRAHAGVFITLSSANVIGGSPVFFDAGFDSAGTGYQAGNIFNQQTGSVNMSPQAGNAWFPYEYSGSGLANRFVTIDLGTPTALSGIEIFNSNQSDRGTLNFRLDGGNSIEAGAPDHGHATGSVLSSPGSLLGPTALTYSTANPVVGQGFTISDATPYRYLQLWLIDGQSQDALSGLGLAEVRISAVPEPAEYASASGALLLGFMAWRRRVNSTVNDATHREKMKA
jgi:hypothetical protein